MLRTKERQQVESAELDLLAAAASLLFANGETTRRTGLMIARLGKTFGIDAELFAAWGNSTLRVRAAGETAEYVTLGTEPLGVDMNKVAAAEHLICGLDTEKLDVENVRSQLRRIASLPPASDVRFVLMCGIGCVALAIILGVDSPLTLAAIGLTGGVAGILRRAIAHVTAYPLLQPLLAAFLGGLLGAFAMHAGIQNAQWVAVVPCIILVPGPHLLNGCLDLARGHAVLGAGRLAYASVIILMICIGLLCGIALGGASLPVTITTHPAPFALDVIAAGLAVAAFGSFFSMPWRTLAVPVLIGMLAHSIRWLTMHGGGNIELGTFLACFTAGVLVTLTETRLKMPFAAMAFAASVSMIPGFYLFHMASGLLFAVNTSQLHPARFLDEAFLNGAIAMIVSITIAFGLLAPKMCIEHFRERTGRSVA